MAECKMLTEVQELLEDGNLAVEGVGLFSATATILPISSQRALSHCRSSLVGQLPYVCRVWPTHIGTVDIADFANGMLNSARGYE
ncbi:hypothetical protein BB561_002912 [Smittium simulii]|uniref:Uncharacterized protein n=1 Tax=Smittium simulii TaxID=133385 RepID=A0A2T9YNS7_9FUNG|nr:hypothetical protein BB561_002912 [Smittium simulii]